ncbi:hypothetical protein PICSAR132_04522 [Mycobacterium avium subsp. paratuberculosis]|nr:hypothetical protein PICSAR132_04522 [Mycobacterium avium subsp. paratuberculosis]
MALAAERERPKLGGEERHVAVVFIDIVGSTQLVTRRPPAPRGEVAVHPANLRGRGRPARGRRRPGQPRARNPLMNGQPISTRMAWLSPVMSSTGLWKGSRTSWSRSLPSTRNRTP